MKQFNTLMFLMGFVIISTLIADILDLYFYHLFLKQNGVSFWSIVSPNLIYKYVTNWPGNILTIIAISPWLLLLAYLEFMKRQNQKK